MRLVVQMIPLSRLLILAWLMTWVATAPLYIIHLSDLPGLPDTTDCPASLQYDCHEDFFSLSNHDLNFEDDNALFLEKENTSNKRKVALSSLVDVLCPLPNRPLLLNSISESRAKHPRLRLFATLQGPRAPPSIISF